MKKHKLLIAVIMFGLTWAGIVRAEAQPIEQQTKPTILRISSAAAPARRATTLLSHAEHAEKFAPPHLSNPGHRNGENMAA